jgi:aminoacrylate peracid reductase
MPKKIIVPTDSPPPLAPYSPGVLANGVLYISGIVAVDAQGKIIGQGDVVTQTRAVLNAIQTIVQTAGGTMADITFNSIFLKSLDDYEAMNEVYREIFSSQFPARYCLRVDLVKPEFLVEISSVAHVSER